MVDITKDEFWESRYEEVSKTKNKNNGVKDFVIKHKIITVLLVALTVLIITNTILIYNFFRIFINM